MTIGDFVFIYLKINWLFGFNWIFFILCLEKSNMDDQNHRNLYAVVRIINDMFNSIFDKIVLIILWLNLT